MDGCSEHMSQLDTLKVIQDVVSCFRFTNVRRVMKYDLLTRVRVRLRLGLGNCSFILLLNSFLVRLDALHTESSVCQGYGTSQQET